jgi:hypothetical protein
MSASLDALKADHRRIEAELQGCEPVAEQAVPLAAKLRAMRPLMLDHLTAKDVFYAELRALCSGRGDLASVNTVKIFEDNMRVQSAAIRRFFSSLDGAISPMLSQTFRTMALVIRSRIITEERAVFPLYLKNR